MERNLGMLGILPEVKAVRIEFLQFRNENGELVVSKDHGEGFFANVHRHFLYAIVSRFHNGGVGVVDGRDGQFLLVIVDEIFVDEKYANRYCHSSKR